MPPHRFSTAGEGVFNEVFPCINDDGSYLQHLLLHPDFSAHSLDPFVKRDLLLGHGFFRLSVQRSGLKILFFQLRA
jgi:hypothetical protein